MKRRHFLQAISALGLAAPLSSQALLGLNWFDDAPKEFWLSATGHQQNKFAAGWVNNLGSTSSAQQLQSGFRGHGLAQNPSKPQQVIMAGRSPGTKSLLLDLRSGKMTSTLNSSAQHHFQGHGCFSANGKLLYMTEAHEKTGQGRISVWETQSFTLVETFSSHGIGPHEIALMPDNQTLVIANGGLHKKATGNREILNLDSMDSNLVYLDSQNGDLISQHRVKDKTASLRHLDVALDGTVAVAVQVKRKTAGHNRPIPLAMIHSPGQKQLTPLHAPEKLHSKLNDYMGSVCIHSQQGIAAFTSPKGDLALFWDVDSGQFLNQHAFHNVCGLTLDSEKKHFILSNSAGKIRQINILTLEEDRSRRMSFPNIHWDNHMLTAQIQSS